MPDEDDSGLDRWMWIDVDGGWWMEATRHGHSTEATGEQ